MEDEHKKTKEEIAADLEDAHTIEQLLSMVGVGWSISLNRIRPSWCKGWLETIDISPDEPLDMDYIADTWGGESIKLRLMNDRGKYRGGKVIHIAREPLRHGRPIEHPDDKRSRLERENRSRDFREESARLNAAQPKQDNSVFTMLVDVLKDSNASSAEVYKDLLKNQNKQGPMGISEVVAFANGLKELQGVFGDDSKNSGGGDSDDENMLGTFVGILERAHERDVKREDRKETRREHEARRTGSRKRQDPLPGRTGASVHQIPNPKTTSPEPPLEAAQDAAPDADDELALSEELSELDPAEAAEVLGEAFTMMSPEKRAQTMKLLAKLGNVSETADVISGDGSIEDLADEDLADEDPADEGTILDQRGKPFKQAENKT